MAYPTFLLGLGLVLLLSQTTQAQLNGAGDGGAAELMKAMTNLAKCRQTTGASEEDVRSMLETHRVPSSHAGKCLIACMGETYGVMKDGKFNAEAAMQLVDRMMKSVGHNDAQLRAQIQQAVNACSSKAPADGTQQDACEAAAALSACGMEEAEKIHGALRQRG